MLHTLQKECTRAGSQAEPIRYHEKEKHDRQPI